ncbi:hypothetical protein PG989_013442 [Apiospora arundinis]|uniref:Uncharacterized protein n=1 Tax=Apiospora arundinis TaxID=335852 RepID=A0ABR2IFE1_9PEZI
MCAGAYRQQRTRGPIPIIVCCKTEHIGAGVIQSLKPEYDVVHIILDTENASREILSILHGKPPPPSSKHSSSSSGPQHHPYHHHHRLLGSKRYGTGEALRPRAVLFGGHYDEEVVERLYEDLLPVLQLQLRAWGRPRITTTTTATIQIPLLKANQKAAMPPLGPEYGRKIVQRAKGCLRRLEEEGKFDGQHGGIYLY